MDFYSKEVVERLCISTAEMSLAKKRKVGAVLTLQVNGQYAVLATGCNYNPDGSPCETEEGITKDTVIHAEQTCLQNYEAERGKDCAYAFMSLSECLLQDAKLGQLVMFISHYPCKKCSALLQKYALGSHICESFMKFDKQKPRMALVPASLGISCARALTYGARKYKANNWRKTDSIEQYISAITRHFDAWREGEENDPESGLSHLDHMAANLSFLIELKHLPKIKVE